MQHAKAWVLLRKFRGSLVAGRVLIELPGCLLFECNEQASLGEVHVVLLLGPSHLSLEL